jgi:hypothetical protein
MERIEGFEDSRRGECHERCCRPVVGANEVVVVGRRLVQRKGRPPSRVRVVRVGPRGSIGVYSVVLRGTDPKGGSFNVAQKEPNFLTTSRNSAKSTGFTT